MYILSRTARTNHGKWCLHEEDIYLYILFELYYVYEKAKKRNFEINIIKLYYI